MTTPPFELTEREKKVKDALEKMHSLIKMTISQGSQTVTCDWAESKIGTVLRLFDPPPAPIPVIPAWEDLTDEQRDDLIVAYVNLDSTKSIYETIRAITSMPRA
jgi:hypothetical protein